ncbi:12190_t:CDS:2 [Rhizophagus irregularis]|nr:12190_t:CDS:2 [Rhizophagus irregularis]
MDKAQFLTTNEWIITKTTGIAPGKRREINDVINNETRKFYAFSGLDTNDQNVTARRVTMENRFLHSAVLTPDERIIVFGGNKDDIATPVLNPLAVLNTKVVPYEWSVPTPAPPLPLTTNLHSATLVGNYMFNSYSVFLRSKLNNLLLGQNSTTVNTSSTGLSVAIPVDNGKQIGIIIGAVGLSWS